MVGLTSISRRLDALSDQIEQRDNASPFLPRSEWDVRAKHGEWLSGNELAAMRKECASIIDYYQRARCSSICPLFPHPLKPAARAMFESRELPQLMKLYQMMIRR